MLLTWLPRDGRLINQVGTDHSQSIAGGIPILALDMYEHAYHLDFGANAAAYVAAFMRNIDWSAVQGRYDDAIEVAPPRTLEQKQFADVPAVSPEEVKAMLDGGRRRADHRHPAAPLHHASVRTSWRARCGAIPSGSTNGSASFRRSEPVVTFCVYGFHIGCETAITLRKAGFDARYMAGGHYGWKAIGGKVRLFEGDRR